MSAGCGGVGHISCVGPDGRQYLPDGRSRDHIRPFDSKDKASWTLGRLPRLPRGVVVEPPDGAVWIQDINATFNADEWDRIELHVNDVRQKHGKRPHRRGDVRKAAGE